MDIVERLRDTTGIHEDLIYEAADMIERVRICDAYNAKSVAWANVEITRLQKNQSILITSFRINMMRLCPEYSHEEFDKDIAAMLKEPE